MDPSWPTETTHVHKPNLGWGLAICAAFLVTGLIVLPVTAELGPARVRNAAQAPPAIVWAMRFGLPLGFIGLGALGATAILREMLRDRTIRSAADGLLPGGLTEPVNDPRRIAHAQITHGFKSAETGWSLAPLGRVITRTQKAILVWCVGTWIMVNVLLWRLGPERRIGIAMTLISVSTFGFAAIAWWIMEESRAALRRFDIDESTGTFRLDGDKPRPLSVILAVQLCPLRIKVGPFEPVTGRRWGYGADAVEVNLVLRERDSVERETLLVNDADFLGAARLARELADRLGVPLLNHATATHWEAEKERAKDRPWTHRGAVP